MHGIRGFGTVIWFYDMLMNLYFIDLQFFFYITLIESYDVIFLLIIYLFAKKKITNCDFVMKFYIFNLFLTCVNFLDNLSIKSLLLGFYKMTPP